MILTIFEGRYGDGYVAMLTCETSHASAIVDNFTGGDDDFATVGYGLHDLPWFPLVTSNTVSDILEKLQQKLDDLGDVSEVLWKFAVNHIGARIGEDSHRELLRINTPLFEAIKDYKSFYLAYPSCPSKVMLTDIGKKNA